MKIKSLALLLNLIGIFCSFSCQNQDISSKFEEKSGVNKTLYEIRLKENCIFLNNIDTFENKKLTYIIRTFVASLDENDFRPIDYFIIQDKEKNEISLASMAGLRDTLPFTIYGGICNGNNDMRNVEIILKNKETDKEIKTYSNNSGKYRISADPGKSFTLLFKHKHDSIQMLNYEPTSGEIREINIKFNNSKTMESD